MVANLTIQMDDCLQAAELVWNPNGKFTKHSKCHEFASPIGMLHYGVHVRAITVFRRQLLDFELGQSNFGVVPCGVVGKPSDIHLTFHVGIFKNESSKKLKRTTDDANAASLPIHWVICLNKNLSKI